MGLAPSGNLPPAAGHLYVVTNAHVADAGGDWLRFNDQSGGIEVRRVDRWFLHPDGDDIAIAPVDPAVTNLRTANVPFEMSVTPDLFQGHQELGPGDEAFFIGRFVNRDGKSFNVPTARFGAIAQVGGDPIVQKERGNFLQESILVECHSLSGFSGSPVFAYRSAYIRSGKDIAAHLGRDDDENVWIAPQYARVYLLGVDWGSDPWVADVRDKTTDKPVGNEYVRASSGMAMVVPAWRLRGALDHPELIEARRQREEVLAIILGQKDPAVMDVAPLMDVADSIEKTKSLVKEVLEPTKEQIDEVHQGHDQ
jgi:hypothetical protein